MPDPADAPVLRILIGEQACALPARILRDVMERTPATRLPGTDVAVLGLVSVRGELLVALDLPARFGESSGDGGMMVVLEHDGQRAVLLVTAALDVVPATPSEEPIPERVPPGAVERLVTGPEGDLRCLLDPAWLLRPLRDRPDASML